METGEFQTLQGLCENPPNAPPNSNFYPYIDSVCIGFQISYSTETWSVLFSVLFSDGRGGKKVIFAPLPTRVALAPTRLKNANSAGYTFLGFLWPSLTTCVWANSRHRRSDDECACMGEGQKPFSHNALVRLVNLNIEIISLLLKC